MVGSLLITRDNMRPRLSSQAHMEPSKRMDDNYAAEIKILEKHKESQDFVKGELRETEELLELQELIKKDFADVKKILDEHEEQKKRRWTWMWAS